MEILLSNHVQAGVPAEAKGPIGGDEESLPWGEHQERVNQAGTEPGIWWGRQSCIGKVDIARKGHVQPQ